MSPSSISSALEQLADLAEIRGASVESTDLRRAVRAIEERPPAAMAQLIRRAKRGELGEETAVSPTIRWKLREVALGGSDATLRAARAGIPYVIRRLLEITAVTTTQAAILVRRAGILTLEDPSYLCLSGLCLWSVRSVFFCVRLWLD